uniref:Uncharacterized protein n=1 Tax=Anguilla anguilla TaxID=7936 RepID=A0A0E9V560_ANGAN
MSSCASRLMLKALGMILTFTSAAILSTANPSTESYKTMHIIS